MSNYEARRCTACGAPMKANSMECEYCHTGYEYIGPHIPDNYYRVLPYSSGSVIANTASVGYIYTPTWYGYINGSSE